MSKEHTIYEPVWLLAGALAWAIPGAGHFYVGRPARGLILFLAIGATFWAGMAMGGAYTVDRQEEPWWYATDMLAGVHGWIGSHIHRSADVEVMARLRSGEAKEELLAAQKLDLVAPVDTIARAYCGVAGLLNLMCVFDAIILAAMGPKSPNVENTLPQTNGKAKQK